MLFLQKLTHNTMKRNVAVSALSQIHPAEKALAFGGQQPPYKSIHVAKRDVQPPPQSAKTSQQIGRPIKVKQAPM